MLSLSPELCGKIVEFCTHRRQDLLSLCLTCKAFQREAEARVYSQILMTEPQRTVSVCHTILHNERLAQHVRTFWFTQEQRRPVVGPANLGSEFWTIIQLTLLALVNLEALLIADISYANSWVLDSPHFQFRLRELKLRFPWDEPVVHFLERQPTLRALHLYDPIDSDIVHDLMPRALPDLQVFDGSLLVSVHFLSCQLTNLQVVVDNDPEPALALLPLFSATRNTLRAFSLLDVPDSISASAFGLIIHILPNLRHIGLFPYPMNGRYEFHKHLMQCINLRSLELDISQWHPPITVLPAQRALAAELQTFCPTLRIITFWMANTRIRWTINANVWQSRMDLHQYPQFSNAWLTA